MYSKLQDGSFMICGRVPWDAEFKHVGEKNSSLCKWSVKAGSNQNEWVNCQAWHGIARTASNIKKGDTVFCIGKIEANEYEGKTYKNLVCEYVQIMERPAPVPSAVSPVIDPESIDLNEFEVLLKDEEVPF